jgi:hypothetical protein
MEGVPAGLRLRNNQKAPALIIHKPMLAMAIQRHGVDGAVEGNASIFVLAATLLVAAGKVDAIAG